MDALSTENVALKLTLQEEVKRNREKVVMMRQKSKRKRKRLREKYEKRWCWLDLKCRSMAKKCDNSADSGEPESDDDREVMEVQIDELKEALDNLASEKVCTYDAGTYDHKIRECCMKLLSNNVSIRNVEPCIKAVLDLIGKDVDKLPKKSTLANTATEARSLAHLQLAEELPLCATNILHSDGTTKFGHKYGGFQVTSKDSSYTLCISDMKAGGAKDFKEILEQALCDVEAVCNTIKGQCQDTGASKAKKILASIKNTMSDRHIVEKNFNDLLDTYR